MKIRYVVSSMVFWWRENHLSFEQDCGFLKSLGFGIELWPNAGGISECRYARHNWARLANATKGMLVSMRSRSDEPTLEHWKEQIECAKMLGANIVTNLRSFGVLEDSEIDGSDFSEKVVQIADENKVKLCIETGSLKTLKEVGKKFDSISYCFDAGFAYLDPEFSFKQYVDELASRIAHLHLTDNYGQIDDHEPPGLRGGIPREDWSYLLGTLNEYDNEVIGSLEMSPCTPAVMIRKACEFLFDELKWPHRPQKQPSYASATYNPP
ncbi:hypothetical protein ES703_65834 [subsurface metagenome]